MTKQEWLNDKRTKELNRQLGGGCDANNGGKHIVIKQGKYAFCGDCGESLKGVRYNHDKADTTTNRRANR